jgi:hypothetical protein
MKAAARLAAWSLLLVGAHAAGQDRQVDLNAAFQEAQPFCDQWLLPNSMARLPGFDLQKHLRTIEAELRRRAVPFRSPAGRAYLGSRIKDPCEDLVCGCADTLLGYLTESQPNKPLQPTRAAEPNGQREPAGSGPARLSGADSETVHGMRPVV